MKLLEIYHGILESKATEAQGLNILKKAGIENQEAIMGEFVKGDESKNQKNLPIMAFIYSKGYHDIKNIIEVMKDYNDLESLNKIRPIQLGKDSLSIGDRNFKDFLTFSEFIHGEKNKYSTKSKGSDNVAADFESEKEKLWSGNGIDIYDGNNVGKCIAYTQGGLTGKGYSFCIGQPANTMYKSYRDTKDSSFYYIVDRNHFKETPDGQVDLSDPLHMVVFDQTKWGPELTDANNTTGTIAEPYGDNANKYVEYLSSMGVPVEKMLQNRPKTPEEEEEEALLGKRNTDLGWFMKLPIEYKSAYIGRGHQLSDEQFDYLIGG